MRSETEIRQRLADLRTCLAMPCGCQGEHARRCQIGAKMMKAVIFELEWALGSIVNNHQVRRMHDDAEAFRARSN